MTDRKRDRMLVEATTAAQEARTLAREGRVADSFTHAVLTGTATRLMLLIWGGAMVASFLGCALFHTLLGG